MVAHVEAPQALQEVRVSDARRQGLQLVVAQVEGHQLVKAGEELKVKAAQRRVTQVQFHEFGGALEERGWHGQVLVSWSVCGGGGEGWGGGGGGGRHRRNKMVKPHECFRSQSRVKLKEEEEKKRPTVVARLTLVACLVIEIIQG